MEIKEYYEHKYEPSVFVMFNKNYEVMWCYSGNELRRIYLENPADYISEPLELAIPGYLDEKLTDLYENY